MNIELKVFKMDDCSWVCAISEEKAKEWYMNTTGVEENDLDIRECDIDKETMYSETNISEIVSKLENMENYDEFSINVIKKYGSIFISETFKDVINFMIERSSYEKVSKEPFEICSTEW